MESDLEDLSPLKTETDNGSTVYNAELDIFSEKFNPLKALYDKSFNVMCRKAKVRYQNMAAFETAYKRVGILGVGTRLSSTKQTLKKLDEEVQPIRRFQEHQMPITSAKTNKLKHTRNVLTKMAQRNGPLKKLYTFVNAKQRVRITVRKENGVKGYIEGYLQCFDVHWNLLLIDVTENYQKRKFQYIKENTSLTESQKSDCYRRLHRIGITPPKESAKSINRKSVQITRNVKQLLLRGEHVVMIRAIDKDI